MTASICDIEDTRPTRERRRLVEESYDLLLPAATPGRCSGTCCA